MERDISDDSVNTGREEERTSSVVDAKPVDAAAQHEAKRPELPVNHPHPQRHLGVPTQWDEDNITCVETCEGIFPELDPFCYPPGTNNLPTVYTNVFDSNGEEMPNTLPSTPSVSYNLHDGEADISEIDPTSPTDDLHEIFYGLADLITGGPAHNYWAQFGDCTQNDAGDVGTPLPEQPIDPGVVQGLLQRAIDILEGNPIPDRVYSGFPLLHYNGPNKIKSVTPVEDDLGNTIGGNVDVHQIWYDSHIESDTAFLDLSRLKKDGKWIKDKNEKEITWTITYTIDVLRRGKDDFSPMVMYFDDPEFQPEQKDCDGNPVPAMGAPLPNVSMDQTFLPIHEGTRTILRIKMAPPKYYNLTYTWGWRMHPPRVQVIENAGKELPPGSGKKLPEFEVEVFGKDPTGSQPAKENAIAKISDLAPEKRMWLAFRDAMGLIGDSDPDYQEALAKVRDAWCAYHEWKDRNHLPSGVQVDPDTDLTLFYANNTIYGELSDGGWVDFPKWRTRGTQLKVTLINGDYFDHGYMNIDFGGARGWESQFKSSVKVAGSGCRFSFGRFYWSMNLDMKKPVVVKAARKVGGKTEPTVHKVFITYNFEPSRRLRFYQFDPMHHDVAVYSLH